MNTIFVVSDLHLGPGCDPRTKVYPLRENFVHDAAFKRWAENARRDQRSPALLVLNGDIFDFLRVSETPSAEERNRWGAFLQQLGDPDGNLKAHEPLLKSEITYGLRTNDYKTVFKLSKTADGHNAFFEALSDWVASGNGVTFVRGNHDVEMLWPLVQKAVRAILVQFGAPEQRVLELVRFEDEGVLLHNIYIEHGHRFEYMTKVVGGPTIRNNTEINLPLGSFVNRYFINRVEKLNPFIDNIKPVNTALLALFRRHPLSVLRFYFSGWRFIWKAVRSRRVLNRAVLAILIALLVPTIALLVLISALVFPNAFPQVDRTRAAIMTVVAAIGGPPVLPYVFGFIGELWAEIKRLFGVRKKDEYMEAASELGERKFKAGCRRTYVVFGHTHVPLVADATVSRDRSCTYVNSGSWAAVWNKDRPDLSGRVLLTVVRFRRDQAHEDFEHEYLIWDDSAGVMRQAILLV